MSSCGKVGSRRGLSRSIRVIDRFSRAARDNAMRPPSPISLLRKSRRFNFEDSARYSATATMPGSVNRHPTRPNRHIEPFA